MGSWGKLGREGSCPTERVVPTHPAILASDPQRSWSLPISGSQPLVPTRGGPCLLTLESWPLTPSWGGWSLLTLES